MLVAAKIPKDVFSLESDRPSKILQTLCLLSTFSGSGFDPLVLGGYGMDVELNEVAFRSVGRPPASISGSGTTRIKQDLAGKVAVLDYTEAENRF